MSAGNEFRTLPAEPEDKPQPEDKFHWCYYGVALILAVMALVNLNDFRYALAAQKRWAQSAGRVTASEVVTHHGRHSTSYSTFVSYAYAAGSSVYNAGPLELNKFKFYLTEGGAQADLDEHFPRGKSLTVYYDPSNPSASSLGLAGAPSLAVPFALFLLAWGAVYFGRQQ
jgi:hypothetical protein